MEIKIIEYIEKYRLVLEEKLADLQDYLAKIDRYHILRTRDTFDSEKYTEDVLKKVHEKDGKIFFAEKDHKIIGLIVLTIREKGSDDLESIIDANRGRVVELYVDEKNRGQGIGDKLINEAEKYFKKKKCNMIRIGVMADNVSAMQFYKNRGYEDRFVDLGKRI